MEHFSQKILLENTLKRLLNSDVVTKKNKIILNQKSEKLITYSHKAFNTNLDSTLDDLYLIFLQLKKYHLDANNETSRILNQRRNVKKLIVMLNIHFEQETEKIIDSKYYYSALKIIFDENNFRNSFIPLLINIIIDIWRNNKVKLLINHLIKALSHTKNTNYLTQYPILKYILSDDCFLLLVNDIFANKISIDITNRTNISICQFLKIGKYFIFTPFFEVFFSYLVAYLIKQNMIETYYSVIKTILISIQSSSLSKRVIAQLITKYEFTDKSHIRDSLVNIAYSLIGNPSVDAYWLNITDGEDSEILLLKETQKILKKWLTNKFLTIFFNNLSSETDDDRREFWLNYVDSIIDFKILVSSKNYHYVISLMSDVPIEYVESKVSIVVNNPKHIFILKFSNKTIIEFSTKGNAGLVYNNDDFTCPNLNSSSYNYHDFKMSNWYSLIFQRNGYKMFNIKDSGRLFHNEGWETFMHEWIKINLDI